MNITYRIEQYDIDDVVVIITAPEHLSGIKTRIRTPHFLLSELQDNINTNLTQSIRRFSKKHKQFADILQNEKFQLEPDKHDVHCPHNHSCWFYTEKFIADTEQDISDEHRQSISYENLIRYDSSYLPASDTCFHLTVDPRWLRKHTGPIKIKSLEPNKAIGIPRMHASLGLEENKIYKFVQYQNKYAPHKGNTYGPKTVFPRHRKDKNGHICFPITELQKYINLLHKRGQQYKDSRRQYESIKESLIEYSKKH